MEGDYVQKQGRSFFLTRIKTTPSFERSAWNAEAMIAHVRTDGLLQRLRSQDSYAVSFMGNLSYLNFLLSFTFCPSELTEPIKKNSTDCINAAMINWLRGVDLNHQPSGYGPDELPLLYPAIAR